MRISNGGSKRSEFHFWHTFVSLDNLASLPMGFPERPARRPRLVARQIIYARFGLAPAVANAMPPAAMRAPL
jgi:hypothetical protein